MNRLFLSIFGMGISVCASATANPHKLNNHVIHPFLNSKKQVQKPTCSVTVNLQQEQYFDCDYTQTRFTTLICATGTASAPDCTVASHDAQVIAQNQMVANTVAWFVAQIVDCENATPQE